MLTTNDQKQVHRRSIRLKGYDYSQLGAYFVTICAHDRACLFGEVVNSQIQLNEAGRFVEQCWLEIPLHFPQVELDGYAVMPNHVHGIIVINGPVGAKDLSPLPKVWGISNLAVEHRCMTMNGLEIFGIKHSESLELPVAKSIHTRRPATLNDGSAEKPEEHRPSQSKPVVPSTHAPRHIGESHFSNRRELT
jgi:hypothetical protein